MTHLIKLISYKTSNINPHYGTSCGPDYPLHVGRARCYLVLTHYFIEIFG
ncbi:MAG: hypothetical protein IPN87_00110 [Saprospiraceae bacterium]|nr:hypothetical protein [Candidatus Brachybacter algidus]